MFNWNGTINIGDMPQYSFQTYFRAINNKITDSSPQGHRFQFLSKNVFNIFAKHQLILFAEKLEQILHRDSFLVGRGFYYGVEKLVTQVIPSKSLNA